MKIQSIIPRPYAESVEPSILLDLRYSFARGQRIPFNLAVTVRAEDRRVLGIATLLSREPAVLPLETVEQGQATTDATEQALLLFTLTSRVLDHIERLRLAHRKRDVVLY